MVEENFNEKMEANSFIIAMDNYFALPKVIYALGKLRMSFVGIVKYSTAWTPSCLKVTND